jgi:hypothetical protein
MLPGIALRFSFYIVLYTYGTRGPRGNKVQIDQVS